MARTLSTIWISHLLRLLTIASKQSALATGVSCAAVNNSINASDLVQSQNLVSPFPYSFPDEIDVDDLFPMPECNGLVLEEATVDQLQDAMSKGHLTSTEILMCYLQRIQQTNGYTK